MHGGRKDSQSRDFGPRLILNSDTKTDSDARFENVMIQDMNIISPGEPNRLSINQMQIPPGTADPGTGRRRINDYTPPELLPKKPQRNEMGVDAKSYTGKSMGVSAKTAV